MDDLPSVLGVVVVGLLVVDIFKVVTGGLVVDDRPVVVSCLVVGAAVVLSHTEWNFKQ